MTVIMGYKKNNKIYLAADNRTCTEEGIPKRDDTNKIVVVDDVAIAFAGSRVTQKIFELMVKKRKSEEPFCVDNAIVYFKRIYKYCKRFKFIKYSKAILKFGTRCIIAGKNKDNEYCICIMSILNGELEEPSLKEHFIFPPADASPKECCDLYYKNAVIYNEDFMQKTVKDISQISNLVSSSSDVWICDVITGENKLEHFS